jgi:hypothetical protein
MYKVATCKMGLVSIQWVVYEFTFTRSQLCLDIIFANLLYIEKQNNSQILRDLAPKYLHKYHNQAYKI